eukprot:462826-Karenia_brevis.AAC.1
MSSAAALRMASMWSSLFRFIMEYLRSGLVLFPIRPHSLVSVVSTHLTRGCPERRFVALSVICIGCSVLYLNVACLMGWLGCWRIILFSSW